MELEQILARYGAAAFGYGYENGRAVVTFKAHDRIVRFEVVLPPEKDFYYTKNHVRRTPTQVRNAVAQAERQRWRALVLMVKAKLEAVDAGMAHFEQEFLANILLPDGTTVGTWATSQLEEVYATGSMPSVLPGVVGVVKELTA